MRVRPISIDALVAEISARLLARQARSRVAIDGAPACSPGALADALVAELRRRGRFAIHVSTDDFMLPASQRYEFGRASAEAFYEGWRDIRGLRREVLDPASPGGDGKILPALWRTDIDRSARASRVDVPPAGVVVISGQFLLGAGLPFEAEVHLDASEAALARRTPACERWTLPAYERYRQEVRPSSFADVVVRLEDPKHPALVLRD